MGDSRGFLELRRSTPQRQPVETRTRHWREFYAPMPGDELRAQAGRCMDCGVPFCQSDSGCPVQNVIPEWNDLVSAERWADAADVLHSTNNFPELTGRLCPAPCESACVLSLIDQPVTIRNIEQSIADRAFRDGRVVPRPPRRESGRRVAVVGSGPAGLAAAQQLRRAGHGVVVFERADRIGGLLRYGIPEFKLEKSVLDARLAQLAAEGVEFRTRVNVGEDVTAQALRREFDAVCLAVGAQRARDLVVPGRELAGVHQAMDFLTQQNRRLAGDVVDPRRAISARGKHVIIIGGGDTGSDCAGTCVRQGAASVRQYELLPRPPENRASSTPWPLWPMQLRSSHAHEEGCERDWSVATTAFSGGAQGDGDGGIVRALHAVRVETQPVDGGRFVHRPVRGTEYTTKVDLVLLAMGFAGVEDTPLVRGLGVHEERGTLVADASHHTPVDGVFAAGDARRGASLIVWAIREGRDAAAAIDRYLAAAPSVHH
ncbi:MAG: glutamate synthase, small subunit [Gemmatimonadetes bacterium]|nr:glutamate synthase, small subunit [Gemmatimonadota bacterium]